MRTGSSSAALRVSSLCVSVAALNGHHQTNDTGNKSNNAHDYADDGSKSHEIRNDGKNDGYDTKDHTGLCLTVTRAGAGINRLHRHLGLIHHVRILIVHDTSSNK